MQLHILIFLIGLCVGSFLNAVIYRLKTGEGVVKDRSCCPRCGHSLGFLDLIPVLSFILLKARCRYCGEKISYQYPLVELATGGLFLLIFNHQVSIPYEPSIFSFQGAVELLFLVIISSLLIIIFVYDLKHYIIPDRVVYPGLALTIVYRIFKGARCGVEVSSCGFFNPFLAGIGAGGVFLAIYLLSRGRWLGFGDVKLVFLMGLALGFPKIVIAVFLASFIGSIIGSGLVFWSRKGWKSEIPFGPFLAAGFFIALLYGDFIVKAYFDILTGI